jgi:hypothetical protein
MVKRIFQLLVFSVLVSSCGQFRSIPKQTTVLQISERIVYHNFSAKRTNGAANISDLGNTKVSGSIKTSATIPSQFNNPVQVTFLNQDQKPLTVTYIEHPLIAVYEFSNSEGQLSKTSQLLDSVQFFMRYNHNPAYAEIILKTIEDCPINIDQKIRLTK